MIAGSSDKYGATTGLKDRVGEQTPHLPVTRASARAAIGGLVWTLVRTDFKARYHGTLSGFVWALLKPTAMFLVLMAVFSLVFRSDPTYKLDLLIGLFLWDFFGEGTKTGLTSLHAKGFLLTKARCPSWILVVTSISNALMTITVFGVVIAVFLTLTGRTPTPGALVLFSTYIFALAIIIVGFSLGASVLFLRYRDLNQVWDVVTQAGFFLAPIIYPLGVIPEQYHFYLYAWPVTPVIQFSRAVLVDRQVPTLTAHGDLATMALGVLVTGVFVYRRYAPRAAEYL
jgi:homopolymeric O-antigen transport system permease protein